MNRCAFCIPIHPKHYEYAYYILETIEDADLYFIFSNKEEQELFRPKLAYNSLLLTDFTDIDAVKKVNSFVTIKKFYALMVLKNKYDYIACIDAEVKFLINKGFYKMMKAIADSKTVIGVKVKVDNRAARNILYESLINLTPKENHKSLQEISQNFTIYTWWSNVPVYDCSLLTQFFNWVQFKNFTWFVFDHLLYNYYCVLFHNYQIKIVDGSTSLETASSRSLEKIDKTEKLYWVNYNAFSKNTEYYINNGFYIVYHCDRIT